MTKTTKITATSTKEKKKYFVASDIHSFFTIFHDALIKAGFDINNKNHILLILGDVFDRGEESVELYNFLINLPQDRLILVKGNHEYLYSELLIKDYPDKHDFHNGTVKTFCQIAGVNPRELEPSYWYLKEYETDTKIDVRQKIMSTWKHIKHEVNKSEITEWLESDKWVNYYELDNYIFVHSFIPLRSTRLYDVVGTYNSNWRDDATEIEWLNATWGCPWKLYQQGFLKEENTKGKTLVVGHWYSYDFREKLDGVVYKKYEDIDFGIYYSKDLIAIDACTALSKQCNVMVIDSTEKE